jgi:hypothetical protein
VTKEKRKFFWKVSLAKSDEETISTVIAKTKIAIALISLYNSFIVKSLSVIYVYIFDYRVSR